MYFDGNGDYLSIPNSTDWDFGTDPYTIDFWIRWNAWGSIEQHSGIFNINEYEFFVFVNGNNNDLIWGVNA